MRLNGINRLVVEDFQEEDQAVVEQLARVLNPFLEQLTTAFNGNIGLDNLTQELVSFTITVDANGMPKTPVKLKTTLSGRIQGAICIRALNLENDGSFVTGSPFVSFVQQGNLLAISNVAGLVANKRYNITILLIG